MVNRSNYERLSGFYDRQMDGHMDICNSRVAFATEKQEVALWNQAQTESILTGSPAV